MSSKLSRKFSCLFYHAYPKNLIKETSGCNIHTISTCRKFQKKIQNLDIEDKTHKHLHRIKKNLETYLVNFNKTIDLTHMLKKPKQKVGNEVLEKSTTRQMKGT